MGDMRYLEAYERVQDADDRVAAIRRMNDAEVIKALGAAATEGDEYLANVLTTEALNRQRRFAALFAAITIGAAFFVALRLVLSIFFAARDPGIPDPVRLVLTIGILLAGTAVAGVTYWRAKGQISTLRS